MKIKFRTWLLLAIGAVLAVGVSSCKKEDDTKNAVWWWQNGSELSYEEEEEDPVAVRQEAEKCYQEAFEIIKDSKDYNQAVEKLSKAAEANVDSANMFLAYMYEYGVGVKQDIEKAKEYYARETAVNGNEFAVEKITSLNDKGNNYKIVLPEGCNVKLNELAIIFEDTITTANGDGSFCSASNIIEVRNYDGECVCLCYRHPSKTGMLELNSTESAITLLLSTLPYGFELNETVYNQTRRLLLQLPETKQIEEKIDNQLKKQGYFDLSELTTYISKGYQYLYATYSNGKNSIQKTKSLSKSSDNLASMGDGYILDKDGNFIGITEGERQNDVATKFKSGSYDPSLQEWNVTLSTTNYSEICFMAMPGKFDKATYEFIPKYTGSDKLSKTRFISASKALDLGGGKITGIIKLALNGLSIVLSNCKKKAQQNNYDYASWSNPIKDFTEIFSASYAEYKYEHLGVEADIDMEIHSNYDAIKYIAPNEDAVVGAYFFVYYAFWPIFQAWWEDMPSNDKTKGVELMVKACDKTLFDESWMNSYNQLIYKGEYGLSDDNARSFYIKTFSALIDVVSSGVGGSFNDFNKNLMPTKILSSGNKIATKLYKGDVEGALLAEAELAEAYLIKYAEGLDDILSVLEWGEDLTTYCKGIINMIQAGWKGQYLSFYVKFDMHGPALDLSYSPITSASVGTPAIVTVTANRNCSIAIWINGVSKESVAGKNKMTYDLSKLSPGTYKVKFIAVDGKETVETEEFSCTVSTNPLTLTCTPVTSATVGTAANVTATANKNCNITMLVNGTDKTTATNKTSLTYDLSKLSPGTYKIKFKAVAGSETALTQEFTCTVSNATITNPLTISCTPVTSATVGTTANVTATANKNCNITMFVNGTDKTTATNKTSLTYDLSKLSPGTYKIKFKAVAGSETAMTQEFTCTVSEAFVPLSISSTAAGIATKGDITNVTATANKTATIKMYVDGSVYSTVYNQTSMTYDLSELSIGTHYIKFRAEVGTESAESREFQCTVENPTFTVNLAAYVNGKTVSEIDYGTLVEFVAMSDRDCVMDLYIDGQLVRRGSSTAYANTTQRLYASDNLSAGSHTIKVEASEQYGNAFDEITIDVKSKQCYDYIDLGLPSGALWATCNVGAGNPWDYGVLLESEEDPATIIMGSAWRLPTQSEFQELVVNCDLQWTTDYNGTGVKGLIVTSKKYSNKHIFLPVKDSYGRYWSSTKNWYYEGYYYFFQFVDNYTNYNNAQLRASGYGLYGRAVRNK